MGATGEPATASPVNSGGQLQFAEPAADPGLRYPQSDEGEGILVRPKLRSVVPHVTIAPSMHTAVPTTPTSRACAIGR
jgi:hypothetical protein